MRSGIINPGVLSAWHFELPDFMESGKKHDISLSLSYFHVECYQSWQGNVGNLFTLVDVDFIITYDFASFIVSDSSLGIL